MCLKLSSPDATPLIAEEDILCYKIIKQISVFDEKFLSTLKDGDEFQGIINGYSCKGRISIDIDDIFFCTNYPQLDGHNCSDKKGYKYSWILDFIVEEINGTSAYCNRYITYYQKCEIEIGEIYHSEINKCVDTIHEALHSYAFKPIQNKGKILVKCIIPKGSTYYVGDFDGSPSYASDTIKYVEIIDQ